jgi:hypothetical protein
MLESVCAQRETFEGKQDTYVIRRTVCYLQTHSRESTTRTTFPDD